MGRDVEVYDLTEVDHAFSRGRPKSDDDRRRAGSRPWTADSRVDWLVACGVRSLSVFVPGTSQLVQGRTSLGLCFLSLLAFSAALAWAVVETVDRLAPTLNLLGHSVGLVFWMLGLAFTIAAVVHLAAVWNAGRPDGSSAPTPSHPAVPALASALVPGWGQLLNADRVRALLFLAGGWIAAGAWVATSPLVTELINAHVPGVGSWEQTLRAPLLLWTAKWTLPVVVWSLAVYDATSSALARRSTA